MFTCPPLLAIQIPRTPRRPSVFLIFVAVLSSVATSMVHLYSTVLLRCDTQGVDSVPMTWEGTIEGATATNCAKRPDTSERRRAETPHATCNPPSTAHSVQNSTAPVRQPSGRTVGFGAQARLVRRSPRPRWSCKADGVIHDGSRLGIVTVSYHTVTRWILHLWDSR